MLSRQGRVLVEQLTLVSGQSLESLVHPMTTVRPGWALHPGRAQSGGSRIIEQIITGLFNCFSPKSYVGNAQRVLKQARGKGD